MATWREIEAEAPELVARAREIFDARKHKTLATLRRDGSPRISGTELDFADGELWFGSMWKAVKALDLRRDLRFAIHSGSEDPPAWTADAKLAGRAEEIGDPDLKAARRGEDTPGGPFHLFRADIAELVVVGLGGEPPDHLVIESWHEGRGVERRERR
jgi:Pyridoxamine 5'-phosphate oxidase